MIPCAPSYLRTTTCVSPFGSSATTPAGSAPATGRKRERPAKNSFQNDDAVMTMRVVGAVMPGRESEDPSLHPCSGVSAVGDGEEALCSVDSFQLVHAAVLEPEAGAGDDILDRL